MSGNVTPFLDFKTTNDSGENSTSAIQPIVNGDAINQTTLQRPDENLRQRTEALRAFATDSLFLHNADRGLIIAGPGKVTWPGSTTAAASGIPVLTDVLWIMSMLTPGSAQTQPIPPVQSKYGTLHLKRSSDSTNAILVTSQRRSYAAGDQINIEVSAGSVFSCTLQTEVTGAYRRTIKIVAAPSTTLGVVISALNALLPPAPDNSQLVTAALENGAASNDIVLDTQARQFVSGNYDGEGHSITPANLASFFTSNPSEALAEGDTLCAQFAMLSDTASTGGRRQAIPENGNTTVPAGSFFNSRVHPEKLVNALPICKVINNTLVFGTGSEIPAGTTGVGLAPAAGGIAYAGGGPWADGTTNPATTVEGQLDKVISDLAGAAGTGKIMGSVVGTDLSAATLATQIADLATNWGKLARGNTWTLLQAFAANLTAGTNKLGSAADARTARIGMPHSGTYLWTLLFESVIDSGSGKGLRVYVSQYGSLLAAVNAVFDGTNWVKDVNGKNATAFLMGTGSSIEADGQNQTFFQVLVQPATNNTWSAWPPLFQLSQSGDLTLLSNPESPTLPSVINAGRVYLTQSSVESAMLELDLGADRRQHVLVPGGGDTPAVQVIDMHGKLFTQGRLIETDFDDHTLGVVSLQNIVGSGSVVYGGSSVVLNTGASSGDFSALVGHYGLEGYDDVYGTGFRTRLDVVNVSSTNLYVGFWDYTGASHNPDVDDALNGFRIVNGVVTAVWNDGAGTGTAATGLTLTTGQSAWLSYNIDPVNGLLRWHVIMDVTVGFNGYTTGGTAFSGTHAINTAIADGRPLTPFAGVKTTTAAPRPITVDYISWWQNGPTRLSY